MNALFNLRALAGLALGLALPLAAVAELHASNHPIAEGLRAAAAQVFTRPEPVAEVSVAFDAAGRIAHSRLSRSSGSADVDRRALEAAADLASLHSPEAVAGRTLLIRARFASARAQG